MTGPTFWFDERDVTAERALVARLFPALEWRRHGIGALQAYVREGAGAEVRVHVWSPRLYRPGIVDHGDVHDHRFRLHSVVLHGTIVHEEVFADPHPGGDWDVHQVAHARINPEGEMRRPFAAVVPGPLVASADRVKVSRVRHCVRRGEAYTFERGHFHRTLVEDFAVTLITKTDQIDAGARVLSRRDAPAIPAFDPRDMENPAVIAIMREVLEEAQEALRA